MWQYLWDDDGEELEENEDDGEDNTDPYGDDVDPNEDDSMNEEGDDEGMADGDEGEGEGEAEAEVEQKEEEEKKKKDDKDDKGGPGKKPDKKKMDALAKSYNFMKLPPGLDRVLLCPKCKQGSLYGDKLTSTGIRITVAIVKGIIGCDNMEKDLNVARFVCLNKGCRNYWKRTGMKYKIDVTSGVKLVEEPHHFHADI